MLKRVMSVFTGLLVLILFTSCSGKEADLEMRIAPSELSQETRDVLAAIELEDYQSMDCDAGVAIEALFSTERTD